MVQQSIPVLKFPPARSVCFPLGTAELGGPAWSHILADSLCRLHSTGAEIRILLQQTLT